MVNERYKHNVDAVFSLKYHLIFCPKYRKAVLNGEIAEMLKELLYIKAQELGATIHALEIMPDHVHIFVESDPTKAPAHLAAQFKGFSSHILREKFGELRSKLPTLWSRSYFIGSVGQVSEATVKRYIETQKTR